MATVFLLQVGMSVVQGGYMRLVERQKKSRRNDHAVEFPLLDSHQRLVTRCRRRLSDRRKKKLGIEDLKVILSKMGGE